MRLAPVDRSGRSVPAVSARETIPAAFFRELHQTFQRAVERTTGAIDRFYAIGGYTVELSFAGPSLIPSVTPAFEHLAAEPIENPALTVCLWDSASTGTEMPPPPWEEADYVARGEIRGYSNEHIHTVFHPGSGVLGILDARQDLALFWIRDARQLPSYESAVPLRPILHRWMRGHGRQLVHGGAVGTRTGGVLLAGRGGSGKTTTALACASSELAYLGDDYCMVANDSIPFVYSLYSSAKLDGSGIRRFPHLTAAISNPDRLDTEKAVLFLSSFAPVVTADGLPAKAILLPQITERFETVLKKASRAACLAALAPSTIFQSAGADSRDFENLSRFVRQVPSYVLELGTDICSIAATVSGFLSEV